MKLAPTQTIQLVFNSYLIPLFEAKKNYIY